MATIMLRDVPDDLYRQIKAVADLNHRSVPAEIIHIISIAMSKRIAENRYAVDDLRRRLPEKPALPCSVTELLDEDRER